MTTTRRARAAAAQATSQILHLAYQPADPYRLDLEVFTVADLRTRATREEVQATHRYGFHTLLCVTHGECTQLVDFKAIACAPGSLLIVRPGQAHSYGVKDDWDGWNVIFRQEFVLPAATTPGDLKLAFDLGTLPDHVLLDGDDLKRLTDVIAQMREDTLMLAPQEDVHALLRHQLHALLTRLSILHGRTQVRDVAVSAALRRFHRFQQLVEDRHAQWHQVADYADRLGCTEKSLARAVRSAMGTTAKTFIAARINLEAKRLLVHTSMPVAAIAEKLGFDEATNFNKFFRREVGCTPSDFRRRYRLAD
ncbi:helix-turn-helix domain-containing protein [Xanthomonas campestris]|jgi:AraC-like DNA-binding protein|nr:helix-turn-helix domain-containing protein [Xanthomonas campestris]WDJ08141.1 helix-turn-helix domain-containing protein [Xanthomonas campestris pv. incanae]MCC5051334.1 AraC family transcriptional regulator [Xanthomonas campestris pv. aberrans]MCF8828226.1 helix-turn-helix domain-containing protein [Xanthomonas campestris pv. raphani]MCF8869006.1 helix-turn-helix domain-containing protein [Xanthomonas campestris pv. campestris]MDM7584896.1 helix-turn-helix transcriptional regulator [Xantho